MALALISGGSGMIGKALSRWLLARGNRVVVLTRNVYKQPAFGESAVWDGIHPGIWMDWVNQADWVINLAGENIGAKPWSTQRWQQIRDSRVLPGELLTEAVKRASHKPFVFVQMSAIGYYGTQDISDVTRWDESTPFGSDRLAVLCREWEDSTKGVEELGMRRLVIRTGLVLAPKAGVLPRLELPFRFFAGGPVGSGRQVYSWIHINDVVKGIAALMQNPGASGAYNFTSPEPATNREFARTLGKVMHRPDWLPVPGAALKLTLGEMSTLVLDGQCVIPARLQKEAGFTFEYPVLESALRSFYPL
jgi:uncharacterized protein (TIGR01777 family)